MVWGWWADPLGIEFFQFYPVRFPFQGQKLSNPLPQEPDQTST